MLKPGDAMAYFETRMIRPAEGLTFCFIYARCPDCEQLHIEHADITWGGLIADLWLFAPRNAQKDFHHD